MRDPRENPFPYPLKGDSVAVDEMCQCGHPRTQHETTFSFGHGACTKGNAEGDRGEGPPRGSPTCRCSRFSWKDFVLKGAK